jgi:hypothetical protein
MKKLLDFELTLREPGQSAIEQNFGPHDRWNLADVLITPSHICDSGVNGCARSASIFRVFEVRGSE